METPLRFQSEEIPRTHSLVIGNLVFHALNTAEITFGTLSLICLVAGCWSRLCKAVNTILLLLLAFQTWILFAILDDRTLAKIRGEEIPPSIWHTTYISSEVIKVLILVVLIVLQIRQLRQNLLEQFESNRLLNEG